MHIYPWQIDPTPQSIEHRCLEYCYTKLDRSTGRSTASQLSIDALNTAMPNLADLLAQNSAKPLHEISFIYSTMHIYPWQIDPLLQSTIDLWKSITPNKFHI